MPTTPQTTRIKFCGITRIEDALAAVDAGADAIGMILYATRAQRKISLDEAHQIVAVLPPFVQVVGVFVDAGPTLVRQMAASLGLSAVQLHGDEPVTTVKQLRPFRVIKRERQDLNRWIDAGAHALLLESAAQGGSGEVTDFSAFDLSNRDRLPPLILAGGLTPQNVGAAVRQIRPFAVDVSSGIEDEPCVKSVNRMHAFVAAVREADQA